METIDKEDLKEQSKRLENTLGELYLLLKKDENILLKNIRLDPKLQRKLTDEFMKNYKIYLENDEDEIKIKNLTEYDERKNVLYRYDYGEEIKGIELCKDIFKKGNIEYYDRKEDSEYNIKGLLLACIGKETKLMFYKEQYSINTLKEGSKIKLFFTGIDEMRELKETVIRLDHSFDIIFSDEEILIKNLNTLERGFGFIEASKNKAVKEIEKIKTMDIIKNIEDYTLDMDKDKSIVRKIIKITKNSKVLEKCKKNEILDFIVDKKVEGLEGKIVLLENGEKTLDLNSKESRKSFLKLLEDNFLKSELTDTEYEVLAKDEI